MWELSVYDYRLAVSDGIIYSGGKDLRLVETNQVDRPHAIVLLCRIIPRLDSSDVEAQILFSTLETPVPAL
jgi:hypothetical protein